jgi:hypothetical protein
VNDDSSSVAEIFMIFKTMLIVSLEMLSEHNLCAPSPAIPNVSAVCLILLDFLMHDAGDFDLEGVEEIVRAADTYGVVLQTRKQINVTEEEIEQLRQEYKGTKKAKGVTWRVEVSSQSFTWTFRRPLLVSIERQADSGDSGINSNPTIPVGSDMISPR